MSDDHFYHMRDMAEMARDELDLVSQERDELHEALDAILSEVNTWVPEGPWCMDDAFDRDKVVNKIRKALAEYLPPSFHGK